MKVIITEESGIEAALLGLSLSFYDHATSLNKFWCDEKKEKALKRSKALAGKGGGHDKFLETMQVYFYMQASRDFWSEFDTYRVGITKQSSSTMHTLSKRYVNKADFEVGTSALAIAVFNFKLWQFKRKWIGITELKKNLPEGWLQERMISTNYKVLQNIIAQRKSHRLKQWRYFCEQILEQTEYSELLSK